MANDTKGNPISGSANLLTVVKPTELGKKKADLSLNVTAAARKLFQVKDGKLAIPRKRQAANNWETDFPWFQELEAPKTVYIWSDGTRQVEVTWDEEMDDGDGGKGVFLDEEGNKYTGDNVMEAAMPDGREINGSMEALQKLRNAITQFNKATGKQLATRFERATRDKTGRTINQTEVVYRVR